QAVTLPAHEHQCHSLFGIQVAVGLFHRNTLPQVLHLLLETAKFYQTLVVPRQTMGSRDQHRRYPIAHE
ncbi:MULTISPECIES: hypothetical protein, partial [Pseudomonas]